MVLKSYICLEKGNLFSIKNFKYIQIYLYSFNLVGFYLIFWTYVFYVIGIKMFSRYNQDFFFQHSLLYIPFIPFTLMLKKFLIISVILLLLYIATIVFGVIISKLVLIWKWKVIETIIFKHISVIWIHWEQPIIYIQKVYCIYHTTICLNYFWIFVLKIFKLLCFYQNIKILKMVITKFTISWL